MPKPLENLATKPRPSWISQRTDGFHLLGSKDLETGKCIFPRIPETSPSAPRYSAIELSRRGIVYSFTVIHPNPKTDEKPFALVYVDFPEGARAFGRLILPPGEKPLVGMAVDVRIEHSAQDGTSYHFERAQEEGQ